MNSYRFNKARKELQSLATIRIYIPNAPNFGHQSAAIALLDQLTDELEIQNEATKEGDKTVNGEETSVIEVVYEKAVEQKLQTLKPGFEKLDGRIKFTEKEKFQKFKENFAENGVVFTAGSDKECLEREAKELLELMKTACGIVLQPYAWQGGKRCLACKQSYKEDGEVIVNQPNLPESSSYIYDVPLPENLHYFFVGSAYDNKAVEEKDTIKYKIIEHILRKTSKGEIELMVLYGIHQVGFEKDNVLVNIQGGVQQAELALPSVLLLFGPDYLKPRAEGILYSIADITTKTIDKFVNPENRGRQMTILGGQVIQPVFHLACKLSTLPMVFEGANTANLAYMLEKPFISVKDTATPLPSVNKATGKKMLKELVDHIRDDITWPELYLELEKYARMLMNLRRARYTLDSNNDLDVLENVINYVTSDTDKDDALDRFIDNLKAKSSTLEVAKKIFPEQISSTFPDELPKEIKQVTEQLKSDLKAYRAKFKG